MKKYISVYVAALLSLAVANASESERLRAGFRSPPVGGGAQTWWHWTSLFITEKGITADLEAMKAAGYETAHIFTTSSSPMPPGDYPEMLTDGWMAKLKFAGEEMQRLGLTMGVHNCPGWSLSGGPWMTPENSMQMIVASETQVGGGGRRQIVLPQPETRHDYYRDITVLAFRNVNRHDKPAVTADFAEPALGNLLDGDRGTFVRLPIREEGSRAAVTLAYDEPYSPQFIELRFGETHLFVKGIVEASRDGKQWAEAGEFDYRIRTDQRQPKCIPLNAAAREARFFRVTFMYRPYRWWMIPVNVQLNEVRLLASSMVTDVDTRNSTMEDAYGYKPFDPAYITPGVDPGTVLDLSDRMSSDGTLDWEAPEGHWTVLRIGHTTTGKENGPNAFSGLECDKLNRRGLDAHWPHMMGRIIDLLRPTGVLKYAIIDSYEAGGQNWTPGFEQEFAARRGYALKPWLPTVVGFVVGTPQQSARFLYDFQRTVAELMTENYYDYFTELCHANGLLAISEAYFGPFDYLRAARAADIPSGEFWVGDGVGLSRMPASAGHFHGKARVMAESFTTGPRDGRWLQDPAQLMQYGEAAWTNGISQLISHSFVHQPFLNVRPGMTLGANGSHLTRANTWWSAAAADWITYENRGQYLLQTGLPVSDLLVLNGESTPNAGRYPMIRPLLAAGYNYDYVCVDDIYTNLRVREGRLVAPSETSYACLCLGPDRYLTLKTLQRVWELLESGATIAGVRPAGSPSLADDEVEYAAMADKIWGGVAPGKVRFVGRGQLVNTADPLEAVRTLGVIPDVTPAERISFIHRRVADTDIYFLFNDSSRTVSWKPIFRVAEGDSPEFWYHADGTTEEAGVWRRSDNGIEVPVTLAPHGSVFVVFRPGAAAHLEALQAPADSTGRPEVTAEIAGGKHRLLFAAPATATVTKNGKTHTVTVKSLPEPIDLSGEWQVSFPAGLGAPEGIALERLIPLNEHPDEGVRYFSGTATYTRNFMLPKGWQQKDRRIMLDLGDVHNLARVKVNGYDVGLLWKAPFTVDIGDRLQAGENTVLIEVTNLWVNRLIGDVRNPAPVSETDGWPDWVLEDRPNSGKGHYTYASWRGWTAEEELIPSGLIGPVKLRYIKIR